MATYMMQPPMHDWEAADQVTTFDIFQAKAKLWLAGE